MLLDLLLQNHFLFHCSASFSENFYGLKRVSGVLGLPVNWSLHRKSHWHSLLLLCLVPYLQIKLEATLARQREEEDFSIMLAQTWRQRLHRTAVSAYPYASMAWWAWIFCQQLLFVFGVSGTHSPLLWLINIRLARLNAQDLRVMEQRARTTVNPAGSRCHTFFELQSQKSILFVQNIKFQSASVKKNSLNVKVKRLTY